MPKILAKTVQFFKGVELMASKSSATAGRHTEIEVTDLGVKCTSHKSKRTILVPWTNVTGCELHYDEPKQVTTPSTVLDSSDDATPRRGRPPRQELT